MTDKRQDVTKSATVSDAAEPAAPVSPEPWCKIHNGPMVNIDGNILCKLCVEDMDKTIKSERGLAPVSPEPPPNVTCQSCSTQFYSADTTRARCPKCGRTLMLVPAGESQAVSVRTDQSCAQEVISFILAVLQNCEITDAAEQAVADIIAKHHQELRDSAAQLLAWQPICSKGSSGDLRQNRLKAALAAQSLSAPPAEQAGSWEEGYDVGFKAGSLSAQTPCPHNRRTFRGWAVKCVDCGDIVNWEPHTESTKFVNGSAQTPPEKEK